MAVGGRRVGPASVIVMMGCLSQVVIGVKATAA